MGKVVKKYPEAYSGLPGRFVKKIEHDLEYICRRQLPGLCRVYLFGSAARGEVRSTSDIDILIIMKANEMNRELAADIRWTLEEPINGVRTDVVYKYENYKSENSTFERNLSIDKKLILEIIE